MPESRFFSKSQKRIIASQSESIDGPVHFDHVIPYSKGGPTDVVNGQMLSAEENLRKGNKMPVSGEVKFREWQEKFIDAWAAKESGEPFTLVAVPGAGKTVAGLEIARRHLARSQRNSVAILVPSKNLCEQWRDEAHLFGIDIQTRELGAHAGLKGGYRGFAATYHAVAMGTPEWYRNLTGGVRTGGDFLLIADEIHHCGDAKSWGAAVSIGFDLCAEKLLMSGTPFRTDGMTIPWVKYGPDGLCLPSYMYGHKQALRDKVIRHLHIKAIKGSYTDVFADGAVTFDVNSTIDDEAASMRLKGILSADGEFVGEAIREGHQQLMEVRRTVPDAAALIICMDTVHAGAIAERVREITGCDPKIIVQDEEVANHTVSKFRNGKSEWLIAVKQVSEGTDIKRLQLLLYFSNCATSLFFQQALGRISRFRGVGDEVGYVYMPADPRLIRFAEYIQTCQDWVQLKEKEEREERERLDSERTQGELFISRTTEYAGTEFCIVYNGKYEPHEVALIEGLANDFGVDISEAAKVFDKRFRPILKKPEPVVVTESQVPKEDREAVLRKQNQDLARKYAKKTGMDVYDVHTQFNSGRSQTVADEDWLIEKKKRLIRALKDLKVAR